MIVCFSLFLDITYLNSDKYKKGENMNNIKNILVSVATILFVAGCGSGSGSASSSSTATSGGGETNDFPITSTSYTDGGVIPATYVCTGANISPQYTWSGIPDTIESTTIIMDDEHPTDCGTGVNACKHWALYNIPSHIASVAENVNIGTMAGTTEGTTYDARVDYSGPCPPSNHTYKTTIYMLKTITAIPSGTAHTRASFEAAYSSQIIGKATYTGTYAP